MYSHVILKFTNNICNLQHMLRNSNSFNFYDYSFLIIYFSGNIYRQIIMKRNLKITLYVFSYSCKKNNCLTDDVLTDDVHINRIEIF